MKLKEGFVLREVAGDTVVIPSGDTLDLNMMITLNETGKFLWEHLQSETDEAALVAALLAEYDVLFLDEPYKGLDEQTRENVMRIVNERARGKTVLLVTHDRDEAEGYEPLVITQKPS